MKIYTLLDHSRPVINYSEKGFSLIELMIAIGIGLFLLAGITTFMVTSGSTRGELEKSSRQVENGRYANEVLNTALRHAGYYGVYYDLLPVPGSATLPNPCLTTLADLRNSLMFPIQGYNYNRSDTTTPSTNPLSCLLLANYKPKTDILVVRRAQTSVIPRLVAESSTSTVPCSSTSTEYARNPTQLWKTGSGGNVLAKEIYIQSTITEGAVSRYILDEGSNPDAFTLTQKDPADPADPDDLPSYNSCTDIRKYIVEIYFISPCNKPASGTTCNGTTDDGGTPIPTLKRLELVGNDSSRSWRVAPLAEGIEDMQLDYGLDDNSDGTPDRYVNIVADSEWRRVKTVRIYLLARNSERTSGYQDNKQYFMGIGDDPSNLPSAMQDAFKRHVYSATVMLRNYH